MKKLKVLVMVAVALLALTGCGGKGEENKGDEAGAQSRYTEAVEVLNAVFGAYGEADLFAVYGGDQENPVMDAPGRFDISRTEELDYTLGLPQALAADIDDAASMVHLMNGNVFTGAAYRLKDGTDMDSFAGEVRDGVLARQWLCGQPDTLIIIRVDGSYVITAYGEAETIETFKSNALSALQGAEMILEVPIE